MDELVVCDIDEVNDIPLYDRIKSHIEYLLSEYFKPILNEQHNDNVYIDNMISLINYITLNLVFYDIYENIENLIECSTEDIETVKTDLLRMYANDELITEFDGYKDDIVDIFTKYKIKVINHNFVIELDGECIVHNLQNVF